MEFKNKHIGSYGVIIQNEKIVLVKKARGGYLGKLDLPGGGIEHLETPDMALKREILEEAGVNVSKYSLLDATANNIKWQMENGMVEDLHHFGILYQVEIQNQKLKNTGDGRDSNGANWYLIKDLKKEELTPFALYSLEKLGYKIS